MHPAKAFSYIVLAIAAYGAVAAVKPEGEMSAKVNRLKDSGSLYLRQHMHNPVDWHPWGEEAFNKAREEDKPIFLSIGYSSCHWCHVMARDCFENPAVAKELNATFVCVKVDREERPDVDNVYMRVAQLLSGNGGWPLNVLLTPDLKPFSAATYIPPDALSRLCVKVRNMWKNERDKLIGNADAITSVLRESNSNGLRDDEFNADLEKQAFDSLLRAFDTINGGFGSGAKFPAAQRLLFLLRYWAYSGNRDALRIVETTLTKMRCGGIYDHLNSGFHRYAIDPKWLVPHFEKMLYDQAMLMMTYAEAFQITGNPLYSDTAAALADYVLRDMRAPSGAFYAAEDADESYYLFNTTEIKRILTPGEYEIALKIYRIADSGNFTPETGSNSAANNILHMDATIPVLAEKLNSTAGFLSGIDRNIKRKLLRARLRRARPEKDTKIICAWNGLAVAALATPARALPAPELLTAARAAADFLICEMTRSDGSLAHLADLDGKVSGNGDLDDYAFTIWGLIELYEATRVNEYLKRAITLCAYVNAHFIDPEQGGYYDTAIYAEKLLIRPKSVYDGALPSGNSTMMLNQLRLGSLLADISYIAAAEKNGTSMATEVNRSPENVAMVLNAIMFAKYPPWQIVVVGRSAAPDTREMLALFDRSFMPFVSLRYMEADVGGFAPDGVHKLENNACTVFVCRKQTCLPPVNTTGEVLAILSQK